MKCFYRIIFASFVVFVICGIISFVSVLFPRDISRMNGEELFLKYVCNPIPEGVTNIRASGSVSMASTSVSISFRVKDEVTLGSIVAGGGFERLEGSLEPEKEFFHKILGNVDLIYIRRLSNSEVVHLAFDKRSLVGSAYYGGG